MPVASLKFADSQAGGLDRLGGAAPTMVNVLVDANGVISLRPGIRALAEFPADAASIGSPVIGIAAFSDSRLVYVTADRKIYTYANGGVSTLSTLSTDTQLAGSLPPRFAKDKTRLIIAGGGAMQKWNGVDVASGRFAAAASPAAPVATHIAIIVQRAVANVYEPSGTWQFTDAGEGNHETWPALNTFEAEARPDPVVAIHENIRELFIFGTQTTEVWVPDAITYFAPVSRVDLGVAAPYSIIPVESGFAWLDDKRRIILSNGRSFEVLSAPGMTKTFASIGTVSDCIGQRLRIGAFDLLLWLFPTDRRGFVFDLVGKRWSEWRSADLTGWVALAVRSYYYWADRNLHLVGLADGSIAELTFDVSTEGASTKPVIGEITTGFEAHNSTYRKHCQRLTFQMRRGHGTSSATPPRAEYSYRDEEGAFNEAEHLNLGGPGDVLPVARLGPQGVYEMRQHKLTFSGDVPMALVNAEETFTILDQAG